MKRMYLDSYGQSSRHSSKLSLQEKRNLVNSDISPTHGATQLEVGVDEARTTPLSHSAAKHKMAIKPKRTHGVPRRRRLHQISGGSLPVTLEVNEDGSNSGRSVTPDIESNNLTSDALTSPIQPDDAVPVETPACSSSTNTILPTAVQLKSASLPPGLAPTLSNWNDTCNSVKITRSRSSATNRQTDPNQPSISESDENNDVQQNKKDDTSFFGRLLSRRSGKKKKLSDEKDNICNITTTIEPLPLELPQKRMDEKGRYIHEISKLSRNHPALRQRVEPINIPSECSNAITRMHISYSAPTPPLSPELKDDLNMISHKPDNVLMLNTDDLISHKKSLVKKSLSFRSGRNDVDVPTFSSLIDPNAMISLPINLNEGIITDCDKNDSVKKSSDEDCLEDNVGQGIVDEESFNSILNIETEGKNFGIINKSLIKDVTNTNLINVETNCENYQLSASTATKTSSGVYIHSTSVTNDSGDSCLAKDSTILFSNDSLTNINCSDNNETVFKTSSGSVESNSHQISIPFGTSIINVSNDNSVLNDEGQKFSLINGSVCDVKINNDSMQIINPSNVDLNTTSIDENVNSSVLSNTSPTNVITPSDNIVKPSENNSKEFELKNHVSSDDQILTPPFAPVPAPRFSKRDNQTTKPLPPMVPEFLKVQLNHIDNKPPTTNIILSKIKTENENKLDCLMKNGEENMISEDDFVNMKSLEEVEVNEEHMVAVTSSNSSSMSSKLSAAPVITTVPNKLNENITKVNDTKQKSCVPPLLQTTQPVPNPRYSIVSITANNSNELSSLSKNKSSENQIVRKKSIVKDLNGLITEKIHKNKIIDDNKCEQPESTSQKNILRKKSFNKDINNDEKLPYNDLLSSSSNTDNVMAENQSKLKNDEIMSKVILRQKPLINDVVIVETQHKNRKSSLETNTQAMNLIKSSVNNFSSNKNSNDNVKEKYRNSFGSCDTLLSSSSSSSSQDNNVTTTSSEVVYRRKSLSSREVAKHNDKDDEPELLKVFARRSLKIKDNDIILQNSEYEVIDMENTSTSNNMKSRDSDKENECGDSPPEERKKIKDNFMDAKIDNSMENIKSNLLRTQRSFSVNTDDVNITNVNILSSIHKENNQNSYEKRQRSRTFPDNQKIIEPPPPITNLKNSSSNQQHSQKSTTNNIFKDKDIEVISKQDIVKLTTNNTSDNTTNTEDNGVPLFKRIQQRKEEWEKRAQLAMKRTHP